jgi:hypothetical protein
MHGAVCCLVRIEGSALYTKQLPISSRKAAGSWDNFFSVMVVDVVVIVVAAAVEYAQMLYKI